MHDVSFDSSFVSVRFTECFNFLNSAAFSFTLDACVVRFCLLTMTLPELCLMFGNVVSVGFFSFNHFFLEMRLISGSAL